MLTADTCTSVLPEVAGRAADGIDRLIAQAGRYPPDSPRMHAPWARDCIWPHHGPNAAPPPGGRER